MKKIIEIFSLGVNKYDISLKEYCGKCRTIIIIMNISQESNFENWTKKIKPFVKWFNIKLLLILISLKMDDMIILLL